ncbi:hypothetical protein [Litorisediminicola beolgyonensis]|uniref:Alginate export domain-containing protein n=1 Tax=Litorisediminicola beolgyonensis TaxID=1173614 RepID=A0ABW3ZLC1_9RHOB
MRIAALCLALAGLPAAAHAQSVALPEGLEGLGTGAGPILDATSAAPTETVLAEETTGPSLSGFLELRHASRIEDDPLLGGPTLSELRFHLDFQTGRDVVWTLALDGIVDEVADEPVDLKTGTGPIDLREAHVFFRPLDNIDLRAGRQILTWGTGDLVFVNDLFPKDYRSFFAGRADDYLKAPVDAVRVSGYFDAVNVDLALMDAGQTDRIVTGERLSFTDPATGVPTATAPRLKRPDGVDAALRLYRTFGSWEAALYGFRGHWKSPAGQDDSGRALFPRLNVLGASVRGPVLGGIGYLEVGHFDSVEDRDGSDPSIANSEWRALLGHEREIAQNTTLGLQYSATVMSDRSEYRAALPDGAEATPELRDVATLRLTRLFLNQTLRTSAFLFHSPSQEDGFLRVTTDYDVTDSLSLGLNLSKFYGARDTPFGQFRDASAVGISARWSF